MPDPAFQVIASTTVAPRPGADAYAVPGAELPNCALLGPIVDRQLAVCRRNGTSLVVLSIGFDGFESVAQRHGLGVESHVLHAAWNRLRNHLRGTDVAVRVDQREFGAVLLNAGGLAAAIVDARLSDTLSRPYGIGAHEIVVSACIGVAIYPFAGSTGDALVAAAAQNAMAMR
jgi:diguanylate cyclase (GGDEF)-like protein